MGDNRMVSFSLGGMAFEYDDNKNQINIKKHGISFKSAARIFFDYDRIEFYDEDHSYDEDRYNTIGDTSAGRISQKAEGALIGNIDQFIGKVNEILFVVYPTKEFQNTLIRYSIRPEQLIGNAVEKSENYDLMSVVTICLGESGTENYTGIVKFMDVLLSSSRAATEKKKILEEEFGVAMNEDLEREVLVMCNLSQGVKAEGREEGISIGEMRMLVQLVRDGDLKMERAAEKAKMTVEQFKKVMENTPLQAV